MDAPHTVPPRLLGSRMPRCGWLGAALITHWHEVGRIELVQLCDESRKLLYVLYPREQFAQLIESARWLCIHNEQFSCDRLVPPLLQGNHE